MNQDCALVHEFVRVAKRFFERYPEVDHVLSVGSEGEYCVLEIPMSNEGGFDIHLDVGDREILIHCGDFHDCLLYTSPSPRDQRGSRMPSSA